MAGDVADIPRPLGPHPRRPAAEGPRDRRRSTASPSSPRSSRPPSQPVRQLREELPGLEGRRAPARRRSSSSSARTRTSARSCSTGSPAGRRRCADGATVPVPGDLADLQQRRGRRLDRPAEHASSSTRRSSSPARRWTRRSRRSPPPRSRSSSASTCARFPGRSVDDITDEDLLREVMNTIGKKDRLGEQVRCVVSVSMLTEGWDANTVTHILGVRAFGTQLLCEQVVGRGLRRVSYEAGRGRPLRARVRRGLRRPVQLPADRGPRPGRLEEGHPSRARAARARAIRDHLPAPARLPLDCRHRAPDAEFTPDSTKVLATEEVPRHRARPDRGRVDRDRPRAGRPSSLRPWREMPEVVAYAKNQGLDSRSPTRTRVGPPTTSPTT